MESHYKLLSGDAPKLSITTLSITTLSIMTLSIKVFITILSIHDTQNGYSAIMVSVIMQSVVILSVMALIW